MNNSYIASFNTSHQDDSVLVALRKREEVLVDQVQKLNQVCSSESWGVIQLMIKDAVDSIEKKLVEESKKDDIDTKELYKLQGQLQFARRYDYSRLVEQYRVELVNVKNQIKVYVKKSADGAAIRS